MSFGVFVTRVQGYFSLNGRFETFNLTLPEARIWDILYYEYQGGTNALNTARKIIKAHTPETEE